MSKARLEVIDGSGRRLVEVDKFPFTIGRRNTCDLRVVGPDVSRDHAEIVQEGDRLVLRDRSSNGTFVNDNAISDHPLAHGDRVRLGPHEDVKLLFLQDQGQDTLGAVPTVSAVHDLRQMATLFDGLRAMGAAHALEEVLALVLDMTIEFTGAERGFIMLADAEGHLEFNAGRAQGKKTLPGKTFDTSRRIPEEVFTSGEPKTVIDLLDANMPNIHAGTVALGIRHVLCLPLQVTQRSVQRREDAPAQRRIGVLYLDSRQKGEMLSETTVGGLQTLAAEAAVAIENARLYREEIEKLRLEQELNIAAQMQQALLPQADYTAPGVEAVAVSVPCRAIGGDFFDYVELPSPLGFGFALGDVAGKGPPAALMTAVIQGVFSTRAPEGETPARTLVSLNEAVVRRAVRARFVTMVYGVVTAEGRLTYCNAGHNPPLVITGNGVRRLECGGPVLGLLPGVEYEEETVQLDPGDIIVVFSDGVSESMDTTGEQYEDTRIAECVQRCRDLKPAEILERLLADVRKFSDGTPQHDDLTAMIIRYSGPPVG
jgi:phosphoserine phosphatase RsbU/P